MRDYHQHLDIFQQQIAMEMKINFDQLFNAPPTDLNTTVESPSIEFSQEANISLSNSLNNSVQYKFSFNNKFFDSEEFAEREILYQKEQSDIGQPVRSTKSIKVNNNEQTNKSQQPGERLFYQSQQQEQKKIKEREKIHQEKQKEISKNATFVPTINQKSRKLAERQKLEPKQNAKTKTTIKPTIQIIEEANQKECTFHPKLIAKNKHQAKSKEELFYYLHNTSKIKEMKINKLAEEQYGHYGSNKKGSQEDVSNFLKRNEQYTSIVKKKQELLKLNSERYDLKTGEKLFSPKIIQNKAFNFNSTVSVKSLKSDPSRVSHQQSKNSEKDHQKAENNNTSSKPKSGIFNKKYRTQISTEENVEHEKGNYMSKDENKSQHEVIVEVEENSLIQNEKKFEKIDIFNPDQQDQIQGEDINVWGSNEIKPFELSNVNQYLNASDEDEPEHKNNYVMEILNNLMIRHDQEEADM